MSRPSSPVQVRMSGTYFGVKVNTSSNQVRNAIKKISRQNKFNSAKLLNELRPIFKARLQKRIPKLIFQLQFGAKGLLGTHQLEVRSHGKHKPHKQIREPLSRIVKFGTSYKVIYPNKSTVGVQIKVHDRRNARLNFHNDMKKVPKISKVWSRLDATCLPFVSAGHRDQIIAQWLSFSMNAIMKDMNDYFLGKNVTL